ncbi:hypothetical protein U1Q18_013534 [Sarracenia purpurea var. burkii]
MLRAPCVVASAGVGVPFSFALSLAAAVDYLCFPPASASYPCSDSFAMWWCLILRPLSGVSGLFGRL